MTLLEIASPVVSAKGYEWTDTGSELTLVVEGREVTTIMYRLYDDYQYGPGVTVDDICTDEDVRGRGYATAALARLHEKVPGGNLYATDTTEDGEALRLKYEERTGRRYINFNLGQWD